MFSVFTICICKYPWYLQVLYYLGTLFAATYFLLIGHCNLFLRIFVIMGCLGLTWRLRGGAIISHIKLNFQEWSWFYTENSGNKLGYWSSFLKFWLRGSIGCRVWIYPGYLCVKVWVRASCCRLMYLNRDISTFYHLYLAGSVQHDVSKCWARKFHKNLTCLWLKISFRGSIPTSKCWVSNMDTRDKIKIKDIIVKSNVRSNKSWDSGMLSTVICNCPKVFMLLKLIYEVPI